METRALNDDLTVEEQLDRDVQWKTKNPDESLFQLHELMDDENSMDAIRWLADDKLTGLVCETDGGIIGYVHEAHAQRVMYLLNLGHLAAVEQAKTRGS